MISYINKKNNINNISFKNSFIIKVLRGSHKYKNIYLYKYVFITIFKYLFSPIYFIEIEFKN